MATSHNTHTQGSVKDPEHDGRLKENREAGKTKGTTEASAERASGHNPEGSHKGAAQTAKSHAEGSAKGGESGTASGGDDLKSREYTGKDGEIHHHTTKHG